MKKRVFSGIRPSGRLHIGNYLGGVKGMLALQEREDLDCIYSVVDLHGIMSPFNPKTFQDDIRNVVLDYLGAGLDPQKCHLMIQSHVREHIELAFLLATIYPVSRLEQLPTYKEKKQQQPGYINMGLLYYPVLMAADILIYKAELVPVGKDNIPHIEVTREIARKFNRMFPSANSTPEGGRAGQAIFPETKRFATKGELVPSLFGTGKMSKSVEGSYIILADNLDAIKEKLAKVPTDVGRGEKLPKEGGVANLLALVELFEDSRKRKDYERQYLGKGPSSGRQGIGYARLKGNLAQAIFKELQPIQERRKYFEGHPQEVDAILEEGRAYCSKIAKETLREAKKAMGLA